MGTYDSTLETSKHINRVQMLMMSVIEKLREQLKDHDASKLIEPEKSTFDQMTPKLNNSTYGSEQYKANLNYMKPALEHHYMHNRHHPEHFVDGVGSMTLVDIIEMLCDWKAATERHADGDIMKSIAINQKRFHMSIQLTDILLSTADSLGWLTHKSESNVGIEVIPLTVLPDTRPTLTSNNPDRDIQRNLIEKNSLLQYNQATQPSRSELS